MKSFFPPMPQTFLSLVFFLLGLWCLIAPHHVEMLTISPAYRDMSRLSAITIACFGAQAVLASILIFTCKFTKRTYLVFGLLGSIPFFIFNYYFVFIEPVFTRLMVFDFVGNIVIFLTCMYGYRTIEEPV